MFDTIKHHATPLHDSFRYIFQFILQFINGSGCGYCLVANRAETISQNKGCANPTKNLLVCLIRNKDVRNNTVQLTWPSRPKNVFCADIDSTSLTIHVFKF